MVRCRGVIEFDQTQGQTTVGRTTLDKESARRRDLYLTNTQHSKQTSIPPAGFEPGTPAGERPQTLALDRSATGIGLISSLLRKNTGVKETYVRACARARCVASVASTTEIAAPFSQNVV